jgi:formamidopyrimidine-DNA glycosylase
LPELPEVETTRRGIAPHVEGHRVTAVTLRRTALRWPIPAAIRDELPGQRIEQVRRRAKYLLLDAQSGSAILHLGMSGCLRVLPATTPVQKHDHADLALDNGRVLRLTDPRRFGALLWQPAGTTHELLQGLGPEPLSDAFDGAYLFARSRGRSGPVKHFLMDQKIVVGVGNIYAAEALFLAGIHPARAAGRIGAARYDALAAAVKQILAYSIERGGTTLRDFLTPDGEPGYFETELRVYGRAGAPCTACGTPLRDADWGQRATVYCPRCQR